MEVDYAERLQTLPEAWAKKITNSSIKLPDSVQLLSGEWSILFYRPIKQN